MTKNITGIILAGGLSRRMGTPKMLLPWGQTTVIGQVITTFFEAGLQDLLVVTGGASQEVEAELQRLNSNYELRVVHNPLYAAGEMLSSLQVGLASIGNLAEYALIGLGDQPQLSLIAAKNVLVAGSNSSARVVVPSFNSRRGHPWLVQRDYWGKIMELCPPKTLRDFLKENSDEILYVEADQSVLKDLDTPDEYQREKP